MQLFASLRKKCPYSELFWSVFSPNTGNTDQNSSEHEHFLRSAYNSNSGFLNPHLLTLLEMISYVSSKLFRYSGR